MSMDKTKKYNIKRIRISKVEVRSEKMLMKTPSLSVLVMQFRVLNSEGRETLSNPPGWGQVKGKVSWKVRSDEG